MVPSVNAIPKNGALSFLKSCSYVNQKIVWGGEGKNEKR